MSPVFPCVKASAPERTFRQNKHGQIRITWKMFWSWWPCCKRRTTCNFRLKLEFAEIYSHKDSRKGVLLRKYLCKFPQFHECYVAFKRNPVIATLMCLWYCHVVRLTSFQTTHLLWAIFDVWKNLSRVWETVSRIIQRNTKYMGNPCVLFTLWVRRPWLSDSILLSP